jgi:hypothetical protein
MAGWVDWVGRLFVHLDVCCLCSYMTARVAAGSVAMWPALVWMPCCSYHLGVFAPHAHTSSLVSESCSTAYRITSTCISNTGTTLTLPV